MTIHVELFGIPRERAGVERVDVEGKTLRDVLLELESRFPKLAEACISKGELQAGYLANINARKFTRDSSIMLADATTVLILSADAGG
ncbi:MAG: hypothetical protein Tsb009_04730 [Planctomycetaceae bacterium]